MEIIPVLMLKVTRRGVKELQLGMRRFIKTTDELYGRHRRGRWREGWKKGREKCAQRDGGMPTASRDVAVAFFSFFCPVRHRALHHRRVFLPVPSPTTIPCPVLPPGPPAASLIYWFSAARRAINHGNGGRR